MKTRLLARIVMFAGFVAAPLVQAGTELGPLPPGEIAHSTAGPADELIGFLLFDPALIAASVPPGVRLRTLEEKSRHWPRLADYLVAHPERRGWAWSFYEIIGIDAAHYDDIEARFDHGHGGMAVWYPELVRTGDPDARPLGVQNLALGSWVSDSHLVNAMRSRGFPASDARVSFSSDARRAQGELDTEGLSIRGECRLEGPSFVPKWGTDLHSYETMWTPMGEGDTFEVVTWAGHRSRKCLDASWRVSGTHPFAVLFNDPAHGDHDFLPAEFAYGYMLNSALYRRDDNLYARVAARLAEDPALSARLGKPGKEMESVSWLLGDWDVVAQVQATGQETDPEHGTSHVSTQLGGTLLEFRDTYPSGTQDLGFMSYSPATNSWSCVALDSLGNAVVIRGHSTETGFLLEGDVTIVGIATRLRQTIRREGDRAYVVVNEERAADGSWRLLDTYRYTRRGP